MRVLAIIPARGGSKGIKSKNITEVAGQPLISYAIQSALQSKRLTHCVVSTDDEKIAGVSRTYGMEVQMRHPSLAEDNTPVTDVVLYVLNQLKKEGKTLFDIVILLQPTSPLRTGRDLDNVITMFEEDKTIEGVISVVPMIEIHPARMYRVDNENWMYSLESENEMVQRQALKPVYLRNGCIYAIRVQSLLNLHSLMPRKKKAYVMEAEWCLNIDTKRDLLMANLLVTEWNKTHGIKNT